MTRKLHIGGAQRTEGWEVLNAVMAPHVDHHCNANDLSCFGNDTFAEIYASHVLEHFDYKEELLLTLKEWCRVMIPGGKIYISVPDFDTLATIFLQKDILTVDERFHVMRMMFGGHVNQWDYHVVGLNDVFLSSFLNMAGFVAIRRVDNFRIFNDTSAMLYKGVAISLNMTAEKPLVQDNIE